MLRKLIPILCALTLLAGTGCAWENPPEGGELPQKIIRVSMTLGGAMHEDLFYYIVFNLSGKIDNKPYSVFDGEDRGKFWTVYYMYGAPPYKLRDLYRGFGGKGVNDNLLIDKLPIPRIDLIELLQGTSVQGNTMTLEINLTELPLASDIINMNMIVCNQAIDAESKFWYEDEPWVFDSFLYRGISIDMGSYDNYWSEANYKQEEIANEHEESAPPEADIKDWSFQVITK